MKFRTNTKQWLWGRLQWGHEIEFITKEAEEELEQLKKDNPDIDFVQLAKDVRENRLKPNV